VVNFSDAINVATVEASDFTVDGVIADSFIINSPTQVTFRYLSAPFSVNGLHTMAMAAASILRSSTATRSQPSRPASDGTAFFFR
jgi:hypothetical protein